MDRIIRSPTTTRRRAGRRTGAPIFACFRIRRADPFVDVQSSVTAHARSLSNSPGRVAPHAADSGRVRMDHRCARVFLLTHWDILPPFSLPRPLGVMRAFGRLWTEYDLLGNVMKSWWRIAQAFAWCAVIAI